MPDTVESLMRVLNFEESEILDQGFTSRSSRPVDSSPRADERLDLGRELRAGRLSENLSLAQVAQRCGLSAAQLSRIERGQATRSRVFEDDPEDAALPKEFRRLQFRLPELQRLYLLG